MTNQAAKVGNNCELSAQGYAKPRPIVANTKNFCANFKEKKM
jgi:hypothetical protein